MAIFEQYYTGYDDDRPTGISIGTAESYTTGDDSSAPVGKSGADVYITCQQFTVNAIPHKTTAVRVKFYKAGSGSIGNVLIKIKAVDVSGYPTGVALASGSFDADAITADTAGEWLTVSLGAGFYPTASTMYIIEATAPDAVVGAYARWRCKQYASTYAGGAMVFSNDGGSTWTVYDDDPNNGWDCMFEEVIENLQYMVCQTFTPSVSHRLTGLNIAGWKDETGGIISETHFSIQPTSGGLPTGSEIVGVNVGRDGISSNPPPNHSDLIINIPNGPVLIAGTMYAIVCSAGTSDANCYFRWLVDKTSPTYGNGKCYWTNTSGYIWNDPTEDTMFKELGTQAYPRRSFIWI